jgi:hypothetical protein
MIKKITVILIIAVSAIAGNAPTFAQQAEWRDTCATNIQTFGKNTVRHSDNWVCGSEFPVYHETCLENQPTVFSPLFSLSADSFYRFNLSFNTRTIDGEYWREFYMIVFLVKQLPSGKFPYSGVLLPEEILNSPNNRIMLGVDGDTVLQVIKTLSANLLDGNNSFSVHILPKMFNRDGDNYSIALSIFPYTNDQEVFDTSHAGYMTVTDFKIVNTGSKDYGEGIVENIISPQKTASTQGNAVSFLLNNQSVSVWDTVTAYYKTSAMSVPVMEKFAANISPFTKQVLTFSDLIFVSNLGYDTITVWLEAGQRGDKNPSDDTMSRIFSIYETFFYTAPCILNFENSKSNVYWNTYSKQLSEVSQQWNIINNEYAYVNTDFAENNSFLVSPAIKFKRKQSYKITVRYKVRSIAIPTIEKMNIGVSTIPSFGTAIFPYQKNLLSRPYIDDTAYTEASFFYGSDEDLMCYIYVENFSLKFSGGLFIKEFIIEEVSSFTTNTFIDFDPVNPDLSVKDNLSSTITVNDIRKGQGSWQINSIPGGGSYGSKYYFISEANIYQTPETYACIAPVWLYKDTSYTLQYDISPKFSAGKSIAVSAGRTPLSGGKSDFIFIDSIKNSGYITKQILLSVPVSGFYYIEFGNTNENYAVMLDNIVIINNTTPLTAPQLKFAKVPNSAKLGETNVHFSVTVKNPTENYMADNTTKICYKINNRAVVRENCELSAYQISTVDFSTGVNFSTIATDTIIIKFWVYRTSPSIPAQDTIYKVIVPYIGRNTPYIENFSQNSVEEEELFTVRSSGLPNWNFIQSFNDAYTGNFYAQCNYSCQETMRDYMVFPPLNLIKDSVYVISFYAAASTNNANKRVQLLLSTSGSTYDDFFYNGQALATYTVRSSEYVQFKIYYKTTETKMHFFALYDNSPVSTINLKVDRFVVVDSAIAFLPDISLNSIYSNDTGLICDMALPQDVYVSATNNSFFARDTFLFFVRTDLYDTNIVVVSKIKEEETGTLALGDIWNLSIAGEHFIEVIAMNDGEINPTDDTVRATRYVDVPQDLILSSVSIDNSNLYAEKRGVSASIKSNTGDSLQNVRVAISMNDYVVIEKIIELVTPEAIFFEFEDSLYLPEAGSYHVVVFIASPVPCNYNAFDDTVKATLLKQDTLSVGVDLGHLTDGCVIYPNPAADVIYIKAEQTARINKVQVLDLHGKILEEKHTHGHNATLSFPLGKFSAGIYIIQIIKEDFLGNFSVKVVKK